MSQNFENTVKNAFENFEADVSPQTWMNIQQVLQISSPVPAHPPVPSAAVVKAGLSVGKLAVALITTSAIVAVSLVGAWYYQKSEKPTKSILNSTEINAHHSESSLTAENSTTLPNENDPKILIDQKAVSQPVVAHNEHNKKTDRKSGGSEPKISNNVSNQSGLRTSGNTDENSKSNTIEVDQNRITGSSNTNKEEIKTSYPKQKEVKQLIESYSSEPIAYIIANPISGNAPLKVNFLNNGYAKTSTWEFGDGSSNVTDNQITHVFNNPGTYLVKVTATDNSNKVSTNEISITVKGTEVSGNSSLAEIQNVFTPNGDGYNDVFKVKGTNIASVQSVIFNAYGKQIYQWSAPEGSWDGKLKNGENAEEGNYFYIIEAVGIDSKIFKFKGALRLLR